jgi:hypothetical protein
MYLFKFYLKWDLQQQSFFTGTRGLPFLKLHKCTIIFRGCQAVFFCQFLVKWCAIRSVHMHLIVLGIICSPISSREMTHPQKGGCPILAQSQPAITHQCDRSSPRGCHLIGDGKLSRRLSSNLSFPKAFKKNLRACCA